MKKTKTKTKTKRTKKNKKVATPKREIISEFEDYKAGDKVWCAYNNKIITGIIIEFHPNDAWGPAVSILTESAGFRTCRVAGISKTPFKKKPMVLKRRGK